MDFKQLIHAGNTVQWDNQLCYIACYSKNRPARRTVLEKWLIWLVQLLNLADFRQYAYLAIFVADLRTGVSTILVTLTTTIGLLSKLCQ